MHDVPPLQVETKFQAAKDTPEVQQKIQERLVQVRQIVKRSLHI